MPEHRAELCRQVLAGLGWGSVWLFGRNEAARILLERGLACTGVIDDFTSDTSWMGLPIRRLVEVSEPGAVVINCVQCNSSQEAAAAIAARPELAALSFSDFFRLGCLQPQHLPRFAADTWQLLELSPDAFTPLWTDLADGESRRHLADVLRFRLTTDPAWLQGYCYRPSEQYFEPFLPIPDRAVFVDAGAFHGETTLEFARRYPEYGAIHAFEPSAANAAVLRREAHGLRDVVLHPQGLSDRAGQLQFSAELGSASCVSDQGGELIEVVPLDAVLEGPVAMIKMDLEGHELRALQGAAGILQAEKPCLAIGAYHHPEHFVQSHQLLAQLCPGSQFRLRHYTSGWAETVLYFMAGSAQL